jgi:DNA polymerase sigma
MVILKKKFNFFKKFLGGLSSFCQYLLILAFIKFKLISQTQINQNNLGRLLLDFLEFYGKMFNFHGCTIDVNLTK